MTYEFEETTANTNYDLYILICLIAIFVLGVIALIILNSKASKQLKATEKLSELLSRGTSDVDVEPAANISAEPNEIVEKATEQTDISEPDIIIPAEQQETSQEPIVSAEPEISMPAGPQAQEVPQEEFVFSAPEETALAEPENIIPTEPQTQAAPQEPKLFSEPEMSIPAEPQAQEVPQEEFVFSAPAEIAPEEPRQSSQEKFMFSEPEITVPEETKRKPEQQFSPAQSEYRIEPVFASREPSDMNGYGKEKEQNVIIADISGFNGTLEIKTAKSAAQTVPAAGAKMQEPYLQNDKQIKQEQPMFYKEMSQRVHMQTEDDSPTGRAIGRMTYDTAKSGKTYNEEEIGMIIKD